MVSVSSTSAECHPVYTVYPVLGPFTCLAVCAPAVHAVMERGLEKIQKNAAALVAHASVPEEAKREISTSAEVG